MSMPAAPNGFEQFGYALVHGGRLACTWRWLVSLTSCTPSLMA
ncbi:MAG TPA: hypothetical protein VGG53_05280 [Mycobacterium sp.]